jgi:hypothetical protein
MWALAYWSRAKLQQRKTKIGALALFQKLHEVDSVSIFPWAALLCPQQKRIQDLENDQEIFGMFDDLETEQHRVQNNLIHKEQSCFDLLICTHKSSTMLESTPMEGVCADEKRGESDIIGNGLLFTGKYGIPCIMYAIGADVRRPMYPSELSARLLLGLAWDRNEMLVDGLDGI